MITVIFAKNNTWISRTIRVRTNSDWSHVAILDTCGTRVIEAMGSQGVRYTPLSEFMDRYTDTAIKNLPGDIERARRMLGMPFDLWGLWGIFFRIGYLEHPDKWFCSELVAYAMDVFDPQFIRFVTPGMIYMFKSHEV